MTQTKYENSVNTTSSSASKASEGKEKSTLKAASSASLSNKIPQSKFPKNVLSKISCTKCDTITGRKAPMAPLVSAAVVSSSKAPPKPAPIIKSQSHKAHRASASSTSPKRIRDASSSPQKKASLSPPGSSPRPRLKHPHGRGSGSVGSLEVSLAPTNSSVPKSPGKKREGTGVSPRSQQVSFEQIKKAKLFTEKAIMEGRVFSIFGYFPAIKDALKRRGWVEKIQHSVPYVNPHPNNCVCPHVGYQSVFISPPPLTPPSTTATTTPATAATSSTTTTTSGSIASIASGAGTSGGDQDGPSSASESATSSPDAPCTGEGTTEAEAQLNRDTAEGPSLAESETPSDIAPQPPPPSLASSFSSSSCRSSSPSSPTSSSSVLELVERPQTKTTANLGSSSVENVAPAANDAAKAPSPSESSPQSLAAGESESRNSSPNQSQASDESSSVPGESRRGSKPLDFFPDNEINTAILGPSEIRKGLKECITEKNSALFKYSTTSILKKLKSKSEEANKAKTQDAGENDQQDKEEDNEEGKKEEGKADDDPPEDKEEPKEVEPAPEPYNPYVEYQLSNTDLPLVARLLRNVEPNLLWTWTRDSISFKHLSREQLVNRFPNTPFTTKYGLCGTLQQLHWFSEAAGVDTFVPRGYCIGHEDERTAFTPRLQTAPQPSQVVTR
ncbi:mucin-5AC-like [Penaeus monodon]|uniref:mucin-5AC-like n=1 Tax=Penaeus monodon TaxID=6687 RepID=UPI0018A7A3B1|nr:mucin-5AC-like [Penaeus monodon]